jgi:hypothetical protein
MMIPIYLANNFVLFLLYLILRFQPLFLNYLELFILKVLTFVDFLEKLSPKYWNAKKTVSFKHLAVFFFTMPTLARYWNRI